MPVKFNGLFGFLKSILKLRFFPECIELLIWRIPIAVLFMNNRIYILFENKNTFGIV